MKSCLLNEVYETCLNFKTILTILIIIKKITINCGRVVKYVQKIKQIDTNFDLLIAESKWLHIKLKNVKIDTNVIDGKLEN